MEVFRTKAFIEWYFQLDRGDRSRVDARIERILNEDHFGWVRRFSGMTEIKWRRGLRVYALEQGSRVILLFGGNKNGQEKDIFQAIRIAAEVDET